MRGIRGSGKSALWSALQSAAHGPLLRLHEGQPARTMPGFGEQPLPALYPDPRVLRELLEGYSARDIWTTVVAGQLGLDEPAFEGVWKDRVGWVSANPDRVSRLLTSRDESPGERRLFLFDALDRAAPTRREVSALVRGLLELLLDLTRYRSLRGKAFLRPDLLELPGVAAFPDFSKLNATAVDLRWERVDLYCLLWQRLGNSVRHGPEFRASTGDWRPVQGVYLVPRTLRDETLQRQVFERMAGR
ncbi:MAG: hypothetical protein AB1758_28060, partial [Candidatus Eremiobacterota bacterium]